MRKSQPKRTGNSQKKIIPRIGISLVLLGALFLSVFSVIANVSISSRPDVALLFRPNDAYAAARLAANLDASNGAAETQAIVTLAERALMRDPTAETAVRALALKTGVEADDAKVLDQVLFANELTKRDGEIQLWLINYYLAQNNYDKMFEHIDIAASTSRNATTVLFPTLAAALSDDRFVEPIADILARDPWWAPSLVSAIAQDAPSTENAVQLFVRLQSLGKPPRPDLVEVLIDRLENEGAPDLISQLQSLRDPALQQPV